MPSTKAPTVRFVSACTGAPGNSPDAVVAAAPDLILASWCGKKVAPQKIATRPGWDAIPAVRAGRVVEIKSPMILQPGPAALTDGLDAVRRAIASAIEKD